ncbi:PIN domain-containing protein [Herbaspirillum sp. C7C8]|uniref:PIN domain-containing protein n=1 Tax=Herbaspirillum sp. C7C8 TaxID=2736665 RepID=UPI001F522227|nr:PIN domain-containing protein [Herbaspirillum sp. C7C8]MCI1003288.1 PIN domain-containing protein [Herbaspirillum sp. C7C8]
MAGVPKYTVVLDACVLYPAKLRNLLLCLAERGAFHARWTQHIQNEWVGSLLKKGKEGITEEKLKRTVQLMNAAIEDSVIEGYEYLIDSLELPDADDRHVLAAAIVGHADAIVTFNLTDFPSEKILKEHKIEIIHPDDFLIFQYDLSQVEFLTTVKEMREIMKNPSLSAEQLTRSFAVAGLPQIATRMQEASELI